MKKVFESQAKVASLRLKKDNGIIKRQRKVKPIKKQERKAALNESKGHKAEKPKAKTMRQKLREPQLIQNDLPQFLNNKEITDEDYENEYDSPNDNSTHEESSLSTKASVIKHAFRKAVP